MKRYALNVEDRKELVGRLMELTGQSSQYTYMPRCAYLVGNYTVEKEGTLVTDETADQQIIETLLNEGVILDPDRPAEQPSVTEAEAPQDEDSNEVAERTDIEPEATAEESSETEEPDDEEEDDTPEESAESENEDVDDLTVSVPMAGHTAQSLRNFLNLMYSRGPLLNKALGTNFSVSDALLNALDQATIRTVNEMLDELEEYRLGAGNTGMTGILILPDKVSLCFAGPLNSEQVSVSTQLTSAMNRMAITQKRIQAKVVNDENEKYALRIWLIRLGLNGNEHKELRKILMQNLSGHAAFRTAEEAEKFRLKEKAKRDKLKAAKQAAQGGDATNEETDEAEATALTQPDCGADTAQMLETGA